MEFFTIAPCPKDKTDCWRKIGGYRGIPTDYECVTCGMSAVAATRQDMADAEVTRLRGGCVSRAMGRSE